MAFSHPVKVVLKSTTTQTLSDRFTEMARTKTVVKMSNNNITNQERASMKNRRLAEQMSKRPTGRVGGQAVMDKIEAHNSVKDRIQKGVKSRLGTPKGNVRNRLGSMKGDNRSPLDNKRGLTRNQRSRSSLAQRGGMRNNNGLRNTQSRPRDGGRVFKNRGRGQRGQGRQSRQQGQRGRRGGRNPVQRNDLDQELDSYMNDS